MHAGHWQPLPFSSALQGLGLTLAMVPIRRFGSAFTITGFGGLTGFTVHVGHLAASARFVFPQVQRNPFARLRRAYSRLWYRLQQ